MNLNTSAKIILTIALSLFMGLLICCNNPDGNETSKAVLTENENKFEHKGAVPDSITRYLLTSAAGDFYKQKSPLAIDFRQVQIGYILGDNNERIYLICGEFLSEEKKEKNKWDGFSTIKTQGYEQYIGNHLPFCEQAIFVKADFNLTEVLKREFMKLH